MMLKNGLKKTVCTLLVMALIVVSCPLAAFAAKNTTPAGLFYDGLHDAEKKEYDRLIDHESNYDSDGKRIKDAFIISRKADASVKVTGKEMVADGLKIIIPKNRTLTIAEGATLRIFGELLIEGTLENLGTIIIGNSDTGSFADNISPYLTNEGFVSSSGLIRVNSGTLYNRPGGKIENSGVITIVTADRNLPGMWNSAFTDRAGVTTSGTVINNGTINVENTQGTGLRNFARAVFENNGDIYKARRGTIKGTIRGKAVINK